MFAIQNVVWLFVFYWSLHKIWAFSLEEEINRNDSNFGTGKKIFPSKKRSKSFIFIKHQTTATFQQNTCNYFFQMVTFVLTSSPMNDNAQNTRVEKNLMLDGQHVNKLYFSPRPISHFVV